jgi:hypothetical protein
MELLGIKPLAPFFFGQGPGIIAHGRVLSIPHNIGSPATNRKVDRPPAATRS